MGKPDEASKVEAVDQEAGETEETGKKFFGALAKVRTLRIIRVPCLGGLPTRPLFKSSKLNKPFVWVPVIHRRMSVARRSIRVSYEHSARQFIESEIIDQWLADGALGQRKQAAQTL